MAVAALCCPWVCDFVLLLWAALWNFVSKTKDKKQQLEPEAPFLGIYPNVIIILFPKTLVYRVVVGVIIVGVVVQKW